MFATVSFNGWRHTGYDRLSKQPVYTHKDGFKAEPVVTGKQAKLAFFRILDESGKQVGVVKTAAELITL